MASLSLLIRDVDLSENRQPDLYASSTIPFFFSFVCVGLRLWCRRNKRADFWFDDWLIILALVCATGLTANMLWWIPRGLGRHVEMFGPNVTEEATLGLFIAEMTYTPTIVLVKLSILALYWRIFNKSGSIKIPIYALTAAVVMWGIAVLLLVLFQCLPTRGFWDKTITAACNVDSQKFLFAISIPNILIDVTLLSLPVPYVNRLNVSGHQKKGIISVFLLGGFVCIASIMRLIAVTTQKTDADISWNVVNQGIWAVVEADFAIISACLPTLRPLWKTIQSKQRAGKQSSESALPLANTTPPQKRIQSSWSTSILHTNTDNDEDTRPFSGTPHVAEDDHSCQVYIQEPQPTAKVMIVPPPSAWAQENQELGAIRVENTWDVEYGRPDPPRNEM